LALRNINAFAISEDRTKRFEGSAQRPSQALAIHKRAKTRLTTLSDDLDCFGVFISVHER